MTTTMKMVIFWVVVPCSLVEIDRRFRGAYRLQCQVVSTALMMEAVTPLKRRSISTRLHNATLQNIMNLTLCTWHSVVILVINMRQF
jgi:hypothetical protein